MTSIPNPDDWKDVFTILAVVAMMSVPSWFALRAHKTSEAVLAQTKNGHPNPMRADLDRVLNVGEATRRELEAHRRETRAGFDALRDDLSEERTARRAGDAAIRQDIDQDRRAAG